MDLYKKRYTILGHFIFWLIIAYPSFWMFSDSLTLVDSVKLTAFNITMLFLLFYSQIHFVNRFIETQRYMLFFVASFGVFLVVTLLRIAFSLMIFKSYVVNDIAVFFGPVFRLSGFVSGSSFIITIIAVSYQLLKNRYEAQQRNLALINEQQAAQLQLLKAQMNPHFLFNALNNVYSLTVLKSDDAPKMLLKLSDLLRYVIYDSQKLEAELTREIKHIQDFIALFQMRSEDPLSIKLEISGNLTGKTIEPMILIPIVENCFKHCDFDQNASAFAHIDLSVLPDGVIVFSAKNSFDPNDKQKDAVGGVGLENIQRRLQLRYPNGFDLSFGAENNVFSVKLKIAVPPAPKGS